MILFDGTEVPTTISIQERIYQLESYDNEKFLCNLKFAQDFIKKGKCLGAKHFWNHELKVVSKDTVLKLN